MAALIHQNSLNIFKHHSTGIISVLCLQQANYSTDIQKLRLSDLKRGTGGRSSFNGVVATVFGCTGFLGRYVCNKLGKLGTQLILPYRCDQSDVMRLKLCGDLGQVLFQPFHLHDETSIRKAVQYSTVVINLIGRDYETKNFNFDDVHVKGARLIAKVCREACVPKLIHFSSLNAEENPKGILMPKGSQFLASKWRGEQAVREEFPNAVIFKPSDIYGQEDRFLRLYSHIWRHQFRLMPLWKKGEETIKQPVFCSDVAAGIVAVCKDLDNSGKIIQAVGPKRYKLSELVDWFHRVMRKDERWGYYRYNLEWDPFFQLRVTLSNKISPAYPLGNLHWERLEREHITDCLTPGIPTLEDLDVTLTAMEDQIPWELRPFRADAYYDEELGEFEKPAPPPVVV